MSDDVRADRAAKLAGLIVLLVVFGGPYLGGWLFDGADGPGGFVAYAVLAIPALLVAVGGVIFLLILFVRSLGKDR